VPVFFSFSLLSHLQEFITHLLLLPLLLHCPRLYPY
jgi:hypothetical protein